MAQYPQAQSSSDGATIPGLHWRPAPQSTEQLVPPMAPQGPVGPSARISSFSRQWVEPCDPAQGQAKAGVREEDSQ